MKRFILSIALFLAAAGLFAQQYSRDLKLVKRPRMYGDDVLFVQQKLLSLGVKETGEADGWFGENTLNAVEAFQLLFGFEVNGEVNAELFDYLVNFENEAGLGKFLTGAKTAFNAKYKRHHLVKDLEDSGLSTEGGVITAYYDNKNGGIFPAMAVQQLYGETGRVKNTLYPLGKDSYIYTIMVEYYSGESTSGDVSSIETKCYYVDENKVYILNNGKLESSGITEDLASNPAHIMARLKAGK